MLLIKPASPHVLYALCGPSARAVNQTNQTEPAWPPSTLCTLNGRALLFYCIALYYKILAHADKSKYTTVGYDYAAKHLFVDHGNSGARASTIKQVAPLAGGAESDGHAIELVLLVDRGKQTKR